MDALSVEHFHLVGAKIGGTIARAFAARRPGRVRTLTVVGTPPPYRLGAAACALALIEAFEQQGVEPWAQQSMAGRLGADFRQRASPGGQVFMGCTAVSTQVGFMQTIACADIRTDVPQVACPTLVITTEGSGLATVDETPNLAADDSGLGATRAAWRFLSRRGERCSPVRTGDPGIYRAPSSRRLRRDGCVDRRVYARSWCPRRSLYLVTGSTALSGRLLVLQLIPRIP